MTDCVIVQPIADAGVRILREAGLEVHLAERPAFEALRPYLREARAVITRNAGFPASAIAAAPNLLVIGSHGTGVDSIDVAFAQRRGVQVVNTPGANARSVAELTFALILACARSIPAADQAVRSDDRDFRFKDTAFELCGRTLGLVGFGRIARLVARMARGFDMTVVAWSQHSGAGEMEAHGVELVADIDQLCARADVVSLHALPVPSALFDRGRIARMKRGAVLVNTARGSLVDEAALAEALHEGRLAAAGLDVFLREPLPLDSPLLGAPNILLTPHIGGATREALERTAREIAEEVLRVLRGEPPLHPVRAAAGEAGRPR